MSEDRFQLIRLLEAMLFAAAEPLPAAALSKRMPEGANVAELLLELQTLYANRGVNLVHHENLWCFRTASDLADRLAIETTVTRKLSRAAIETLAIVSYHQPVTRAEIEEIRGVALSQGTLDKLLEVGWIKPKGRRQTPGRPVTWVTTDEFLIHFGLESLDALPGVEELKATGLLDARPAISTLGAGVMAGLQSGSVDSDADEESDEEEQAGNGSDSDPFEMPDERAPRDESEDEAASSDEDEDFDEGDAEEDDTDDLEEVDGEDDDADSDDEEEASAEDDDDLDDDDEEESDDEDDVADKDDEEEEEAAGEEDSDEDDVSEEDEEDLDDDAADEDQSDEEDDSSEDDDEDESSDEEDDEEGLDDDDDEDLDGDAGGNGDDDGEDDDEAERGHRRRTKPAA
jgi:segregation and condensation protein B